MQVGSIFLTVQRDRDAIFPMHFPIKRLTFSNPYLWSTEPFHVQLRLRRLFPVNLCIGGMFLSNDAGHSQASPDSLSQPL